MSRLFPKDDSDFEVTISTQTIVRVLGLTIIAFLLVSAVQKSVHTLSLIGAAFFLSLALNAPVRWLSRHLPGNKKNNRSLATAISIGLILAMLIGFIVTIVPPLAKQTTSFASGLPTLVEDTKNGTGVLGKFVAKHNLEQQVDKLSAQLSDKLGNVGGTALTTVSRIGSSLFATVTVLVLTIMMLTEGPKWRMLIEKLIPARKRTHLSRLAHDMNRVVQGYVNGQVMLAAIAAVLIVPMFFIMGVQYPVALMVVVFICGLIPMVGHTIGALICTLVALFTSPVAALVVLGYYILYQQIENYAVQPKVQANSTNMSPLLVFIAVLLGANFGGLLGALVAIPVMGCLRLIVLDYLEQREILSKAVVEDVTSEGGKL